MNAPHPWNLLRDHGPVQPVGNTSISQGRKPNCCHEADRRYGRRCFFGTVAAAAGSAAVLGPLRALANEPSGQHGSDFALQYILGSCMYGTLPLATIVPEVKKTGAAHLDIWPRRHGNQREQLDEMGVEAFRDLLAAHKIGLGIITRYDLGPFGLQPEMPLAHKLGAAVLVTGSRGPRDASGKELKAAVRRFVEQMKPHAEEAEKHGLNIAIENHGHALINTPDSLRWFAEFAPSPRLGIALAPYHLPQDPELLAGLIRDLGPALIHFYAWQHGDGCMEKLPKERELLQMPGRGPLDFRPILAALEKINYRGWTEIFMHPVPRGIPILPTAGQVTAEINRARAYLTRCLSEA